MSESKDVCINTSFILLWCPRNKDCMWRKAYDGFSAHYLQHGLYKWILALFPLTSHPAMWWGPGRLYSSHTYTPMLDSSHLMDSIEYKPKYIVFMLFNQNLTPQLSWIPGRRTLDLFDKENLASLPLLPYRGCCCAKTWGQSYLSMRYQDTRYQRRKSQHTEEWKKF